MTDSLGTLFIFSISDNAFLLEEADKRPKTTVSPQLEKGSMLAMVDTTSMRVRRGT